MGSHVCTQLIPALAGLHHTLPFELGSIFDPEVRAQYSLPQFFNARNLSITDAFFDSFDTQ